MMMNRPDFTGLLLVSDMDGTLLNSQNQVSLENIKAIDRFEAYGGRFTIATGRIPSIAAPQLRRLALSVPGIFYNGGMIYDFENNRIVWQSVLTEDTAPIVTNIADEFPEAGIEVYHNGVAYCVQENAVSEKHREIDGIEIIQVSDIGQIPKPWQKVLIAGEPDLLADMEIILKTRYSSVRFVRSDLHYLEILNPHVNKGRALERLLQLVGVSTSQCIAVGNHMNDYEMLQTAGVGIAVDNAYEPLKRAATFCCCHHDRHAIADVIDWIEYRLAGNSPASIKPMTGYIGV
jgi:Cof subfamily protein (haloacid dehalogenase superfamily)